LVGANTDIKKRLAAIEILNKRARRPSKNNSTQPTSTIQLDLLEELIMSQKTGEIASGDYRSDKFIARLIWETIKL